MLLFQTIKTSYHAFPGKTLHKLTPGDGSMQLILDIKELWKDFKDNTYYGFQYWIKPEWAPPSIRSTDVGFITLLDQANNNQGCFVPELYELAKVGGLRAQQEEKIWEQQHPKAKIQTKKKQPFYNELYSRDGTRKSPFALGVLPEIYSDTVMNSARGIQKRIENEYNYRLDKHQPLPPVVCKYQIESDYLKNIHLIQLKAGSARSSKLSLLNPETRTTKTERMAHYLAQRAAFVLTMIAVLSKTFTTPLVFIMSSLGVILAKWCSEEFSTYSLTETLLRDIKSNFAKEFRWGDKVSLKKTLKTVVLLAALGIAAYGAFAGTWGAIMGFSAWKAASVFANPIALAAFKGLLAGFASTISGVGTLVGGTVAQRYFWGLGIWDKQIDFSKERVLEPLSKVEKIENKLHQWQQKFENELALILPAEQRDEFHKRAQLKFSSLKELIPSEKPVAASEESRARTSSRIQNR